MTRALDLPEEERVGLAAGLIGSIDGPADPECERARLDGLERREACGASEGTPWYEVRGRILWRLGGA